jgi:hypothetical protein
MYFNGADVGLSSNFEDIDAIEVLPDNRVLISTTGDPSVTGVSGAADEDILAFTPTTLGTVRAEPGHCTSMAQTSDWAIQTMKISMRWMLHLNGKYFPIHDGAFSVTGVSGDNEDVFVCTPTSLGATTACTYSSVLYFDGSTGGRPATMWMPST